MGCGGYSKVNKPDVNGAVYRKITKEQVRVEFGSKVKTIENGPIIIFVYGGPGSKKGRLISELVDVFDFTFINVEKIMLRKMASETAKITGGGEDNSRKESIEEIKKIIEDDPSTVSLKWILDEIMKQVESKREEKYIVDMMPNLKYIIKTADFTKDCSDHMTHFEEKLPISFGLYFSMKLDSKSKQKKKEEEEVKEEREDTKSGFQSDEVDQSRTKRRASMFESNVRSFLDYFEKTDRLVTVDVSSKNSDAISSRVCEMFSKLDLKNLKLVNTVLLFSFDDENIDEDLLETHDVELVRLSHKANTLSIHSLEDSIKIFVDSLNHKEHKTFLVDLNGSGITKNTEAEISKSSIVFVNEANVDRYFNIPGCKGLFKSVSSLENVVCIFPSDTNPSLCKKIAVTFNNEFGNPRHMSEKIT